MNLEYKAYSKVCQIVSTQEMLMIMMMVTLKCYASEY